MSLPIRQLQSSEVDVGYGVALPALADRRPPLEAGAGPCAARTALLAREFEDDHEVLERYYGSWIAVAVARVRDKPDRRREKLELVCAPDVRLEQSVEELLFRARTLYRQVDLTFAKGRDRALCLQMVYGLIAALFEELDRDAATRADDAPIGCARIDYLKEACGRVEGYFRRAAQRRAQLRYLAAMTGGLVVIAGVGWLLARGLATMHDLKGQTALFQASLIAGGAGALLSVLYGMTSGSLRLHTLFANAESGLVPLMAAGALRPLLGALSGTVVYVLLQSELLPLKVPHGAPGTYFYIAVATLAGFSERWARGVLAGTEERIQGAGSSGSATSSRPA
jgi:hypothetical protein